MVKLAIDKSDSRWIKKKVRRGPASKWKGTLHIMKNTTKRLELSLIHI